MFMKDERVYFKSYQDLLVNLTKAFSELQAEDLRDMLFFLQEFRKNNTIPEDVIIYSTELPLEGLEVKSKAKASAIFVGGVDKSMKLKYSDKKIPPIVVIKGFYRYLIVYGEMFAIEAYIRKVPIKSIVLDLDERDIFEVFRFDDRTPAFLTALIDQSLNKGKEK